MTKDLSPDECRKRFGAKLTQELQALMQAGDNTRDDRKPVVLDQQSVGRLSRMDALQGQAMANAMEGRRQGRARAILAALERLEGDEFGWCDDCGEFISARRLDLDPTVQKCVDCAR